LGLGRWLVGWAFLDSAARPIADHNNQSEADHNNQSEAGS